MTRFGPMRLTEMMLFTMLLTGVSAAQARQDAPPEIINQAPRAMLVDSVLTDDVKRFRAIFIDVDRLRALRAETSDRFVMTLFADVRLTGVVEHRTHPARRLGNASTIAWSGRLDDVVGGTFTLVVHRGVVAARIIAPGIGQFAIRPANDGLHAALQIDPGTFGGCETLSVQPPAAPPPSEDASGSGATPVIDVLIVYTPEARTAAGGTANIEAEALLAMANANQAYRDSLVDAVLRLAGLQEFSFPQSGSNSTDVARLRNVGDGFGDDIHDLRDSVGADVVSMFTTNVSSCGSGFLMTSPPGSWFSPHAFNVVNWTCAAGNLSFAHEVGHNQGAQHDRDNAGSTPAFAYSYGWRVFGEFRTVMAYSSGCVGGCPRVGHLSNPDVTYLGFPTGVSTGSPDAAHNALTVTNTASIVAAFRPEVCNLPPGADDCNNNCVDDAVDIATSFSLDLDENGQPDECACAADFDGNQQVDVTDLLAVLAAWGPC